MTNLTRTHRFTRGAAFLTAAVLAVSCDAVSDAVDGASGAIQETATLVQFCTSALRVAQAVDDGDLDKAVAAGEGMVENAPEEIAPAARTVLEGARAAQGGEEGAVASDEFRAAAQQLADFTADRCDPR